MNRLYVVAPSGGLFRYEGLRSVDDIPSGRPLDGSGTFSSVKLFLEWRNISEQTMHIVLPENKTRLIMNLLSLSYKLKTQYFRFSKDTYLRQEQRVRLGGSECPRMSLLLWRLWRPQRGNALKATFSFPLRPATPVCPVRHLCTYG